MPIYEYRCTDCDQHFQKFQSMSAGSDGVRCPNCDGTEVERQLSAFSSTQSTGDSGRPAGCTPPAGGG